MGFGREMFARSSDGREFPVEIGIGPADREECSVAVVRDISEQVLTRQKLERAMAELARSKDRLQAEAEYLREDLNREHHFDEIIGKSTALVATLEKVEQAAKTDATVLLLGETGTGKELLARALHSRSNRTNMPLVKIDCATLPSGLIESELFGHEKGAFTGAHETKVGRFELADGGTVFLDEIGELSLELQVKLLRVLQEGEFLRLGAKREQKVDVRIIAATNRDLRQEVHEGRFRSDLYYRLSVFPIESPPLRDRREDIPLLASYFLSRFQATVGKRIDAIAKSSMEALVAYDWPGNIRELQNVIERSAILSSGDSLIVQEVLGDFGVENREPAKSLTQNLEDVERANILRALEESDWKVKGEGNAASRLGINPNTLRSRMKKLGIAKP
jgi:transcriptional regulator with GAF, ATPase, and Fis domain